MWQVLIVEDDHQDCERLKDGLGSIAQCDYAQDGNAALEQYKNKLTDGNPYDFILLDVTMPEKDGFEVLKSIRSLEEAYLNKEAKESRVIMITSFKDSLMEHYNMGWDEFITKPVDIDILKKRMKELSV